jgi:hypothetical protein
MAFEILDPRINESEVANLLHAASNINRLSKQGYADSRVTGLTTVQSLIDDIETFRDDPSVNAASRPIFDAAVDSIRWLGLRVILNTTVVTALLTVKGGTSDQRDLLYNVTAHSQFSGDAAMDDVSTFQPAG